MITKFARLFISLLFSEGIWSACGGLRNRQNWIFLRIHQ